MIAGEGVVNGVTFAGMAPRASLYGFKVLNDQGEGEDAWPRSADDLVDQRSELHGLRVEFQLTGFDLGKIKYLVDEAK